MRIGVRGQGPGAREKALRIGRWALALAALTLSTSALNAQGAGGGGGAGSGGGAAAGGTGGGATGGTGTSGTGTNSGAGSATNTNGGSGQSGNGAGGASAGNTGTSGGTGTGSGASGTSGGGSNAGGGTSGANGGNTKTSAGASIMQLKKDVTGEFTYRFLTPNNSASAPAPLPAPGGADNIVALPLPSDVNAKTATLEVIDTGKAMVAHLPVVTNGVTNLNVNSFQFVQTVLVPVQVKGQGAIGVQVTMTAANPQYSQSVLLTPTDNGVARFQNVPIGSPVTATASYGGHPPVTASQTLTYGSTPDGYKWSPIAVDAWTDVKTVPPPPTPAPAPAAAGTTGQAAAPAPAAANSNQDSGHDKDRERGSGGGSLIQSILGLAAVAAIGYGLYWAYNKGHFKTFFEKAGINVAANADGNATAPNPFTKDRTPITPITEGTADPFSSTSPMAGGVASAPLPVSSGPRLVATSGTYSGNIFPLSSASMDVGRDASNGVPLPNDNNASRHHATIVTTGGQYTLTDNNSSNGTFLNGVRVASRTPTPIRAGDEVQIGNTRFRFEA